MDGIPVEVWKCLEEEGIDMLWDLMKGIYEQEKIPTEWRDSVIIPIYKEKGDIHDCGNYRWIKLMSHTMKIWERIIDRRLLMSRRTMVLWTMVLCRRVYQLELKIIINKNKNEE